MNHIHTMQADAIYAQSLIEFYERALTDIRNAAERYLAEDGPGAYHMQNIAGRCEQAPMFARSAAEEARYTFTGPEIATGGCHNWRTDSHCQHPTRLSCTCRPTWMDPAAAPSWHDANCASRREIPNGYHCPVCAEPLPGEWNDTEARAAQRMFDHWAQTHRTTNPQENAA